MTDRTPDRSPAPSRFEYRAFAAAGALEALHARLLADLEPAGETSGEEVYLLGPRTDRNAKLRGGAVDVKALRETRDDLERWEPVLRTSLPVTGAWVRDRLARELGAQLEASHPRYEAEALRELVAGTPGLRALEVHKRRQRFAQDGLLAEFARVEAPEPLETVAVEGEDPERVRALVDRIGLGRWPNTSYVVALRRQADAG